MECVKYNGNNIKNNYNDCKYNDNNYINKNMETINGK